MHGYQVGWSHGYGIVELHGDLLMCMDAWLYYGTAWNSTAIWLSLSDYTVHNSAAIRLYMAVW